MALQLARFADQARLLDEVATEKMTEPSLFFVGHPNEFHPKPPPLNPADHG